jgi:hypothetical protein
MRSRRRFWWVTSLALGSLVASRCATSTSPPPQLDGLPGAIAVQAGRPGLVIAAPHGTSDVRTGEIVTELGRRTGFGIVVASGFNLEPDSRESPGRRYQVNRPFEGTPGRPASEEAESDAARRVYQAYEQRVRDVAQGPLVLYVEIHGNNHRDAADRIEIATVGVDRDEAVRLRTLFELIRDAHLRARREAPRLAIFVEPANPLRYAASSAKRDGVLRLPRRALHVELPRAARTDWREIYVDILADFLVQAVPLPAGR